MPVPDFQSLMLPALIALADGSETPIAKVRDRVETSEGLTPEDVREMLPSGRQPAFVNRMSWAVMHMERAGFLERTKRGMYRLMPEGERLLSRTPSRIDLNVLRGYPGYVAWKKQVQASSPDKEAGLQAADGLTESPMRIPIGP